MLVLSRKLGESILIGDSVTVVIQRITATRVTVGIDAPLHVKIVREEIADTPAKEDDVTEGGDDA